MAYGKTTLDPAKKLIKEWEQLLNDSRAWRTSWQEILEYIMPRKSVITRTRSAGSKQMQKVMDSTAINANELLAASIAGSLTNSAQKWFRLVFGATGMKEEKETRDWLDDCADRMYAAIAQSNYDAESMEFYLDIGSIGTSCIYIEEADHEMGQTGFAGLQFKTFSPGEYAVDEGKDGKVNKVFRKFSMPAHAAYDKWGPKAGEKVVKDATEEGGNPYKNYSFLHAIYRRSVYNPKKLNSKNMPVASCYVGLEDSILISEGGYTTFPAPVARWAKTSGEKYGRGPGFTALPDIQTLNETIRLILKSGALAIQPPTVETEEAVVQGPKLTPGGRNVVNGKIGENFGYLQSMAKFDVGQLILSDLRGNIKRIFFNDQLQFPEGQTIMTATEVERRVELMQRLLGPTVGRLVSEYLNPLIERIFHLMFERFAFKGQEANDNAGVPMQIQEMQQKNALRIVYEGPLARAQRSGDLQTIAKADQILAPWVELKPEILDNFDWDERALFVAEITGMPSKLIKDKTQRDEERAQRAEQQRQAMEMQKMQMMAEAAGKAAPALKEIGIGQTAAA